MSESLTGRLLVLLSDGPARASVAALRRAAGRQVATTLDVRSGALPPDQAADADAILFHRLGVALVNVDPRDTERADRIRAAAEKNAARILAVEPERRVAAYASGAPRRPASGHAAGRPGIRRSAAARPPSRRGSPGALPPAGSETTATWGLAASLVPGSKYSGKKVKVAVLDTGFDLKHPDFPSRSITTVSFVAGAKPQDGHRHGTPCIGPACRPEERHHPPRYGLPRGRPLRARAGGRAHAGGGGAGGLPAGAGAAAAPPFCDDRHDDRVRQ